MPDDAVSLRDWMTERFAAQQRAVEQLALTQQRAVEALAESQDKAVKALADTSARETALLKDQVERIATLHADAHGREHKLNQDAIAKAEQAMEQRWEGANKFREQLTEQAATFVRRDMLDTQLASLNARYEQEFKILNQRLMALEHNSATLQGRFWALGIGVGLLVVALNLASRWLP